jgi:hypothetical protein
MILSQARYDRTTGACEETFTFIGIESNDFYEIYDAVLHNPEGSVFKNKENSVVAGSLIMNKTIIKI